MPPSRDRLRRFSAGERWIHFWLALPLGVCIVTAALLYVDPLATFVGRRDLVATIHLIAGLSTPVPIIVGLLVSRPFRADVARLNRFLPGDWAWLRSRDRRGAFPSGKFNAGQKLNSAFVLGAVIVMLVTGCMLHWFSPFPDDIRTGATFVHDVFAAAVVIVTAGHLWKAAVDPQSRKGLRTGYVSETWAQAEHADWAAEMQSDATERSGR